VAELVRLNAEEGLTVTEIARRYGVDVSTVSTRFKRAGLVPVKYYKRDAERRALERGGGAALPSGGHGSPGPRPSVLPHWGEIVRDYRAGDSTVVLAARYGVLASTLHRKLRDEPGVVKRSPAQAAGVAFRQSVEASEWRLRVRTGALVALAGELYVDPVVLREALVRHGLWLSDEVG
jgi:transposase-like protein